MENIKETKKTKKPASSKSVASKSSQVVSHGVGRRKSSVARVWLRRGKGLINVNGKDFAEYFDTDFNREQARLAFDAMKVVNYDVDVNVSGGGVNSQAGAVKLGIARALVEHTPELRAEMRKWRLLSVDPRLKERKKYGQKAARRKFQFVKR
jgi:small subunit ribosomal protein S9